jgi:cytochrome c-type biogenesis protein CcmE
MTPKKRRRLLFVVAMLFASGGATALSLTALKDNVVYFYSPSDIRTKALPAGVAIRIGGLVERNTINQRGTETRFVVTDGKTTVPVIFEGTLPALFREGQGVVAAGALDGRGSFEATEVLAKHDERYMSPEVVDALKRSGHWQETEDLADRGYARR